jgi:tetratricopeptide (TPR) repeat protein
MPLFSPAVFRAAALRIGMLTALAAVACAAQASRGTALYAEGRYVEAAEVFERTENRLSESAPDEKAEYGLYRGLTFLELGDLTRARDWLAFARQVEARSAGALDGDEQAALERAWKQVEHVEEAGPAPAEDRALATTSTPETPPGTTPSSNGRRFVPSASVPR